LEASGYSVLAALDLFQRFAEAETSSGYYRLADSHPPLDPRLEHAARAARRVLASPRWPRPYHHRGERPRLPTPGLAIWNGKEPSDELVLSCR